MFYTAKDANTTNSHFRVLSSSLCRSFYMNPWQKVNFNQVVTELARQPFDMYSFLCGLTGRPKEKKTYLSFRLLRNAYPEQIRKRTNSCHLKVFYR